MFTKDNFKIVFIAPYQSQVELVFDRLVELIQASPVLRNSIAGKTKAPNYKIKASNGSYIHMFTAGTRSGQEAGSARGQAGGMLIFDECFVGTTLIETAQGQKQISEIKKGDKVWVPKEGTFVLTPVLEAKSTGVKEVYRYFLSNGGCIDVTKNHPFATVDGSFTPIDQLDSILISPRQPVFSDDVCKARLYAHQLTDGWLTYNNNGNPVLGFSGSVDGLEETKKDIKFLLGDVYKLTTYTRETTSLKYGITGETSHIIAGEKLLTILSNLHIPVGHKTSQHYSISDFITKGTKETKRAFLAVCFGAEGTHIRTQQNQITPATVCLSFNKIKELENSLVSFLQQTQNLLAEFGVRSSLHKRKDPCIERGRVKWELRISNSIENIKLFLEQIGFYYEPSKQLEGFCFLHFLKSRKPYQKDGVTFPEWISSHYQSEIKQVRLNIVDKELIGDLETFNLTTKSHTYIADGCFVHNCDYLSPKDVDAALAIITNFPQATVWMSSTPTGRREKFYECCHSDLYREYHFPSSVNPNWTEKLDEYYRRELTEDGYKHEILADFAEQEEGVYKAKYVDAALDDTYTYAKVGPRAGWIYMIGVDWNDYKHGTAIMIVGYNPLNGMFYVVEKDIISSSEFTQLKACQRIAELNRMWSPDYIYVDKGYGSSQLEILHKFGFDAMVDKNKGPKHADGRLARIVKGYDFGSKIETYDLFTKQPINKPAKPYLIENSVRRFETLSIKFPEDDKNLRDSLLGYVVKSVSQAGAPTYVQQNERVGDHLLDALNLALVAFTLEKTEFGRPSYSIQLGFTGRIGENDLANSVREGAASREEAKPKESRSANLLNGSGAFSHDLPMANSSHDSSVGLWSWPDFMRDGPKPRVRPLQEAMAQAERKVFGGSRSARPRRKKF
jgi:hypothetical protein